MDSLSDCAAKTADEAIPEVYERASGPLRSQLMRRVRGDSDLADDILHDTWARAVISWRRDGVPERPTAWLAVVARNLQLNAIRQLRRFGGNDAEILDTLADESKAADVDSLLEVSERDTRLRQAVARLSDADASILQKFYFEQIPVVDLAMSLGVSTRAVEGRLRRARGKLRTELATRYTGAAEMAGFPALQPVGFVSGVSAFGKKYFSLVLLPFALVLAFAPLAFMLHRLPRRRLAWLRIYGGALLFTVATISLPFAAREAFAQLLRFMAAGMVVWGIWMLITPRNPSGVHTGSS